MTSLQNHLRQLSGNKQNKKVAFKEGDFFLFLFLVLQEITYFHEKFFFIAWLRILRSFCRFFLFLLLGNLVHHLDEHEDTEGNDEEVETGLEEVTVVDGSRLQFLTRYIDGMFMTLTIRRPVRSIGTMPTTSSSRMGLMRGGAIPQNLWMATGTIRCARGMAIRTMPSDGNSTLGL